MEMNEEEQNACVGRLGHRGQLGKEEFLTSSLSHCPPAQWAFPLA